MGTTKNRILVRDFFYASLAAKLYKAVVCLLVGLLFSFTLYSQNTIIEGKVTDAKTGEPIPFAAISLKGTSLGTVTDFDGNYTLEFTKRNADSLKCVSIGYITETVVFKKGIKQVQNFKLVPTSYSISEVVIRPGENPAHILLRKIIEKKPQNDKARYNTYNYEVYNKLQFDLMDFSEKLPNRKILKKIKFIFNNIDTTADGRRFLPFFMTESFSDFYFRKNPLDKKEIIKATKSSGVRNSSLSQFLGDSFIDFDIYNNFVKVASKSFISPIANSGLLFYKYTLADSAFIGNHWCYKVEFKTRAKQDLTFEGFFWVNDTSFAIKRIQMEVNKDANLNFIKTATVLQDYEPVDGKYWMRTEENIDAELDPIKEIGKSGLFVHKKTIYSNIKVNKPIEDKYLKGGNVIELTDDAMDKKEAYWDSIRPDTLTRTQASIYHIVDTLKSLPVYKRWEKIGYMAMTGFIPVGPFELGPYFSIFTTNTIEGSRYRFGFRTSNKFSRYVEFGLYGAYGVKDAKWKYGGNFRWRITKKRRQIISLDYKHDVELLGLSSRANLQLNIAASIGRRRPLNSLIFSSNANIFYEVDWFTGFTSKLTLTHRKFLPAGVFNFIRPSDNPVTLPSLTTSEISLMTYFAYGDKYVGGQFDRVSAGTKYPAITLTATFGIKGIIGSQYNYQKLVLGIADRFRINPLGYTDYYIEAGKIFGTVPYPFFNVHIGNETYALSSEYFNMANFFEFATDKFARLNVTHHFDGLLFNRIPLIRKLKWRELVFFKTVTGRISEKNQNEMLLPQGMYDLKGKFYMETGVGIENIFKVFRIDVLWRLTHLDHADTPRIGIRGAIQIRL